MSSTFVSEIFSTLQGEGPYTGEPQIFVRLAGCPLRCNYCDTPSSLTAEGHPRMSAQDVLDTVLRLKIETKIGTISVTGGEPLAHASFLKVFLPLAKSQGFRVYLETAGVHPDELARVIEWCDVVAMDIKLPSATGDVYWDEHERFLEIGGAKVFVKVVVTPSSTVEEIERAVSLAARLSPPPIFILQPVSPVPNVAEQPSEDQLQGFLRLAKQKLPDVRIMGQQHKVWNIR